MSISDVVRTDLSVLRRSKLSWAVLTVLLFSTAGAFYRSINRTPVGTAEKGITAIAYGAMIVIPITALVASAFAIAAERENGTIRFLLGFPNERVEVVLGKVLSRAILVNGGLALGFLAVALLAVVGADRPRLITVGQFALLTMLFATSYVGLAVGISAGVTTQIRAIGGTIVAYLFWSIFWLPGFPYSVAVYVENLLAKIVGHELGRTTVVHIEVLNPPTAYMQTVQVLGPSFEEFSRGSSMASALVEPSVAIGSLVAWTVLPLAFGYWRFRAAEIN
ncbi:ABC transporter permease [Halorussus sp. MSC15.2]|uniref:ABC transporter permease n=1 Tax=Halorussus sp. MSC15.2 TaxID=2283638 RepID=UPI0013D1312F|nr:ABC transporter permease subunit [Halorussus sp. MSC15.2]NEU58557.1 ABC transporter permease subunit [Halorussus sp. MSC15.2]